MDIKYAKELGYKIKHVGITGLSDNSIECRVHPVLVPVKDILAQVSGVMNSVILKGDRFGTSMLYGHGAGGSATASAVVSDVVDAINLGKTHNLNLPGANSAKKLLKKSIMNGDKDLYFPVIKKHFG